MRPDGDGNRDIDGGGHHCPVITLNGDAVVTLECHIDTYVELGASVTTSVTPP